MSMVKDKVGNPLTTEEIKDLRWVEHFSTVLNRKSITITSDRPTQNDDLDIAIGAPTLQQVTQAIQQMQSGKTPGTDNICTEMRKTDIHLAGMVFTDFLEIYG